MSLVRQNYPPECEAAVNKQINLEMYASYAYLGLAYFFERDDVALPGFFKFFKKLSDEKRENSNVLMELQNKRGGRIKFQDVAKPETSDWENATKALEVALVLEKKLNQSYIDLHNVACSKGDVYLEDFFEDHFMEKQVDTIKQVGDYITSLKNVGGSGTLGEFLLDKEELQESLK